MRTVYAYIAACLALTAVLLPGWTGASPAGEPSSPPAKAPLLGKASPENVAAKIDKQVAALELWKSALETIDPAKRDEAWVKPIKDRIAACEAKLKTGQG